MEENQRTQQQALDRRLERKIRTIKFIVLSIVLYVIADSLGHLGVPKEYSVPGLFCASVWLISLVLGATLYYTCHAVREPGKKALALAVECIAFCVLLIIFRFYSYDIAELQVYRISVTLLPVAGILICLYAKPFIRWYGRTVKKLLHLESVQSIWFYLSFLILAALVLFAFIGIYRHSGCLQQQESVFEIEEINPNTDHSEPFRRYDRIFDDLQDTQIEAAMKNGFKPISEADAPTNSKLVKIEACDAYDIAVLTHSIPYLVPKAAKLVEDIGLAFQDSLYNRGYSREHRITVTSVTRTEETVKSLQRTNPNATDNSCHCYGTTIDISYRTFSTPLFENAASDDKMYQVLMQAVYDLWKAGRCYVKYEKNQACLHITVR